MQPARIPLLPRTSPITIFRYLYTVTYVYAQTGGPVSARSLDRMHEEPMIRRAMGNPSAVPLTEARARLFRLVEDLLAGRTDRVTLSHRGHDEDVLLLRARDVERMEDELTALRQRVAPEPRPLRGMGRIVDDAKLDDVLAEIRAEQRLLADAKLRSISEGKGPRAPKRGSGLTDGEDR